MQNKIEDLRNHLFATLEALRDADKPMDLDRAKTISEVAQTIINTAKVEVEFIEATGSKGTGFVPAAERTPRLVSNN
jgi:hypothetical protein